MVYTCEEGTLVFKGLFCIKECDVYKCVKLIASARHALQLCVSVLVELGSQERITLCLADVLNSRCN